jgi:septum formation protein
VILSQAPGFRLRAPGFQYDPGVRLILASGSPRRAELLRAAGYAFEIQLVDLDERPRAGEQPHRYVSRLASEKSAAALDRVHLKVDTTPGPETDIVSAFRRTSEDIVIIGADTTVVIGDQILGKPADQDEARSMIRRLSGRQHQVITGISARNRTKEVGAIEETTVWFAPLSEAELDWYSASREGIDKAGAYAIQGLASRFIPRVEGSYSNVVGLPVHLVREMLAGLGPRA